MNYAFINLNPDNSGPVSGSVVRGWRSPKEVWDAMHEAAEWVDE